LIIWWLKVSLPKELKELQDKRTKLEDDSRGLKEEQKNLEENAKELEQKIIERLKHENKDTRQDISRLKSVIDDLGQRLSQLPQAEESAEPSDEATSKSYLKKCFECGKEIPIASEECQYCGAAQAEEVVTVEEDAAEEENVKVGAVEDSSEVTKDEIGDELTQLTGKRKGGFLQTLFNKQKNT
jgi:chromosome segregation ATPase